MLQEWLVCWYWDTIATTPSGQNKYQKSNKFFFALLNKHRSTIDIPEGVNPHHNSTQPTHSGIHWSIIPREKPFLFVSYIYRYSFRVLFWFCRINSTTYFEFGQFHPVYGLEASLHANAHNCNCYYYCCKLTYTVFGIHPENIDVICREWNLF